jgi:DNA-binding CsgD family transcriptional regulator
MSSRDPRYGSVRPEASPGPASPPEAEQPARPHGHRVAELTPLMWLRLQGLTPRESEAALIAVQGKRVREIAAEMGVSDNTIKTLLARARHTLGCHTLRELCVVVVRQTELSSN